MESCFVDAEVKRSVKLAKASAPLSLGIDRMRIVLSLVGDMIRSRVLMPVTLRYVP